MRTLTSADSLRPNMLRLGLCCGFVEQPIKFRTTTATVLSRLSRAEALTKLALLCTANVLALNEAVRYCTAHGIGCFRVSSQILPLKTHPKQGYDVRELPNGAEIIQGFKRCGRLARRNDLRISFHPDQFVVLNSSRPDVVSSSVAELEYQAEVAEWLGADVINVHAGGAFGDKNAALIGFARGVERLSPRARSKLTVENDDRLFTPADLLPLCRAAEIPLVYDVHHHRCNTDGLSEHMVTEQAFKTWHREPLFHVSSPLEGWHGPRPQRHHDYIDPCDFPRCWLDLDLTVEVEAKAKELAVARLQEALAAALN